MTLNDGNADFVDEARTTSVSRQHRSVDIDDHRWVAELVHRHGAKLTYPYPLLSPRTVYDTRYRTAICIPARNEAERLSACVRALQEQTDVSLHDVCVIVIVNNSDDRSFDLLRHCTRSNRLALIGCDVTFPASRAHAGAARRLAMELGLNVVGQNGILMTTDADSKPAPNWLTTNLELLERGYDAVCGQVQLDPLESAHLPDIIHQRGALEGRYLRASLALDAALDPDPYNPWPHHGQAAGASLAVTAPAYRAVDGLPSIPSGEDRAFVRRLKLTGLKVCHSSDALVATSCRLRGRAAGGMAETLAARLRDPDAYCDEMLEPAVSTWRRASARGRLRRSNRIDVDHPVLTGLQLSSAARELVSRADSFAEVWPLVEALSPALERRRVRPSDIVHELPKVMGYLERLSPLAAADRRDSAFVGS